MDFILLAGVGAVFWLFGSYVSKRRALAGEGNQEAQLPASDDTTVS